MALIIYILPIYLLELDIPIQIITLISGVAAIPWLLKFFWGGVIDYFFKFGRKRFIILGATLSSICLIILTFIYPKTNLIPFGIFLFFSHIGIIFIDVSADAWAIEISRENERGKINGSMITGMTLGIAIGATLFSVISKNIGYPYVFLTAGFLVFLSTVFPLVVKEIRYIKKPKNIRHILFSELKKSVTILVSIFGFFLMLNHGLHYIFTLFEKTELNLDIVQIGLLGNFGIIWAVIGALVGGYLSDRWGRKNVLFVFIIICMIFSASLIFIKRWEDLYLYIPVIFSYSAFHAAFLALAMDITNPRVAATQFSIISSVANFGEWFGATISGTLVVMLGFSRLFLYSALALAPAIMILYLIRIEPKTKKN
jgi:PAT family beta-lactamase induction signal transducer AmpG